MTWLNQAKVDTKKYAMFRNENVIDAHVYQIKKDLPSPLGGMFAGLAQSRTPHSMALPMTPMVPL